VGVGITLNFFMAHSIWRSGPAEHLALPKVGPDSCLSSWKTKQLSFVCYRTQALTSLCSRMSSPVDL